MGNVPCLGDIDCIEVEGGVEVFHLDSDIYAMSEQIFCKTMGSELQRKRVFCSSSIKILQQMGGGSSTTELVAAPKISCKECNGMC